MLLLHPCLPRHHAHTTTIMGFTALNMVTNDRVLRLSNQSALKQQSDLCRPGIVLHATRVHAHQSRPEHAQPASRLCCTFGANFNIVPQLDHPQRGWQIAASESAAHCHLYDVKHGQLRHLPFAPLDAPATQKSTCLVDMPGGQHTRGRLPVHASMGAAARVRWEGRDEGVLSQQSNCRRLIPVQQCCEPQVQGRRPLYAAALLPHLHCHGCTVPSPRQGPMHGSHAQGRLLQGLPVGTPCLAHHLNLGPLKRCEPGHDAHKMML
jgi:hypothetical protein